MSIIDLSAAGRQPIADSTGRYVMVYNGEVYNFRELRRSLEQRHGRVNWKGSSDSEVVIEGFAREGSSFLSRLNGIFALAIYDEEQRSLHILRDPLGIKPLFVSEQNGTAYFCSEMKGLAAIQGVRRTLKRGALADQLAFMYIPEPHTLYEEIQKVEPGVCLTYREGRRVGEEHLFGWMHEPLLLGSQAETVEQLRELFTAAVERQLVADVPVSLFLSGGLDSSAVAQRVVAAGGAVKDAYTIVFRDEDRKLDEQSDDLLYARVMAERLGLRLIEIEANRNMIEELPDLISHMEDGFTDPAAINTNIIARYARRAGVKVMLSGQGADEFLGGYRRYIAASILSAVPRCINPVIASVARFVSGAAAGRMNSVSRRAGRVGALASLPSQERLLAMYAWTPGKLLNGLFAAPNEWDGDKIFAAHFDRFAEKSTVDAMMCLDERYDLLSLNLCYTDRMSMAVGVEVRVPFLDFDLVRLMRSLPPAWKVRRGVGKYLFKKAMEGVLPHEVIYRQKAGFGLPIRAWLRYEDRFVDDWLEEDRLRRQGIFDPQAVRRLVDEQRSGVSDNASTIFTLLCQQIWLEHEKRTL